MRNLRRTAQLLVLSGFAAAACATYVAPELGEPVLDDSGGDAAEPHGGSGNSEGGSSDSAGTQSTAGTDSSPDLGGTGGTHSTSGGSAGAGNGGKAGSGSANGGGGSGGAASGGTASGGKGGAGGSGGAAGIGGGGGGGGGTGGSAGMPNGGTGGGGAVNLITNSGFETNATGWSVFGGGATIATSTAQAKSGAQSLLVTGRTQTYQGPQYNVLSVVTSGTSYSLSVWGRLADTNPSGSLIATMRYTCTGGTNAGDNFSQWVTATAASASSWTELKGVKAFPTCGGGGALTAAWLYIESPTATLSYYIDDIVLTTP